MCETECPWLDFRSLGHEWAIQRSTILGQNGRPMLLDFHRWSSQNKRFI